MVTLRQVPRRFLLWAALLALVSVGLAGLPGTARASQVTVTIDKTRVDLVFNDPVANSGEDRAQLNKIISLFDGAPAGSTIRIGLYSITANIVGDAIKRAVDRGVNVYAVHNGEDQKSTDDSPDALANLLGSRHRWCDHGSATLAYGGGCLSNSDTGLMHMKYILFSRTKDASGTTRDWVTWVSSANMTYASGAKLFNNTFTFYGDKTLHDGFVNEIWTPQWNEQTYPNNDFYVASAPRGYFGSADSNTTVYASPEQTTDLVVNRLGYLTPDSACRIRVMQASINDTRIAVINKLIELKQGGCKVWVGVGNIQPQALAALKGAGIPVRKSPIHDKMFLIYGKYGDTTADRTVVLTGSHNLSLSALRHNDELLIKVTDSQPMYDAFYDHFNDAYNTGSAL
ncbi:phospholipase D-like domain-containing protein [Microlunatus parietis]|uniref:phospholipase D n=1 Tax=Microlunatus parietis TaxID=682979 RepID=A0A7Y9IF21_9ACTN|nr:phospholipase D-like domain-containing protein [Microlunatus parietis]NYE75532.1 phosphatidylserine/phosphatidylglycerophosphate/cardiolipin synthase-like enzyme [Microlunatus parietis]